MRSTRALALSAIAIMIVIATLTVSGSISAGDERRADPEALTMSADRLDLDLEAKTAVLTGHVKLERSGMTLGCPRVDVRYDQVPHVVWAKGSGGVVAEVKGVRAEAPEVELDLATRVLDLRGGVRVRRGEGWITAERAGIHIATGKVTMSDVKGSIPVPKPAP